MVLKNNLIKVSKKRVDYNFLYKKILGLLIKCGLKSKAKNTLDSVLFISSKKLNNSPKFILLNVFIKLNTFIEIKKIYLRNRVVFVPFYATYNRRLFLIARWLVLSAKLDNRKVSFKSKLLHEIFLLLTTKRAKSLKFKNFNIKLALKSRSNIHYRW